MNVNITTKKEPCLNQEKTGYTEKTVIETITIKDVHSFSDMEDAFTQIAAFSESLFREELEEDLKSMKLNDIPEQKGEAKEEESPRLTVSEIVDKYRFAKVFGFNVYLKIDQNTGKYIEYVNTHFNEVNIHNDGLEIDPSWQLTPIPYRAYERVVEETYTKIIKDSKLNPEPDPHDFLEGADYDFTHCISKFMSHLIDERNANHVNESIEEKESREEVWRCLVKDNEIWHMSSNKNEKNAAKGRVINMIKNYQKNKLNKSKVPQPSAQAERFMDGLKEDEYRKIDSCFKSANEIFNTAKEIISAIKEVKNQSAPKPNFASGGFVSGVDASKIGEIIPPRTASDKPENQLNDSVELMKAANESLRLENNRLKVEIEELKDRESQMTDVVDFCGSGYTIRKDERNTLIYNQAEIVELNAHVKELQEQNKILSESNNKLKKENENYLSRELKANDKMVKFERRIIKDTEEAIEAKYKRESTVNGEKKRNILVSIMGKEKIESEKAFGRITELIRNAKLEDEKFRSLISGVVDIRLKFEATQSRLLNEEINGVK